VTVNLSAYGFSSATGTTSSGSSSTGGTLNIGVMAHYTGDNAVHGTIGPAGCLSGARVNAARGVLGARLACKPFDAGGDPADADPAANQMVNSANPVMMLVRGMRRQRRPRS
jgi:ABC-type branched-subunit amino acid transport system substrate-binding protein